MSKIIVKELLIFLVILSQQAFAFEAETFNFRCESGEIVRKGDTKAQVIKKCGEPMYTDIPFILHQRSFYDSYIEIKVEDWTYIGKNEFIYRVRFYGNNVFSITNEGR